MVLKHLQKCKVHCNSSKKFRNVLIYATLYMLYLQALKYNNLHVAGAGEPMTLIWNSLAVFFFFFLGVATFGCVIRIWHAMQEWLYLLYTMNVYLLLLSLSLPPGLFCVACTLSCWQSTQTNVKQSHNRLATQRSPVLLSSNPWAEVYLLFGPLSLHID